MSKKPCLTIMTGLPRSGKTTWIQKNKKDAIIVSPDDIRKEIFGHQFFKPGEAWVWALTKSLVRLLMLQRKNIIVDATHLFPWLRREWVVSADELNYKSRLVWINTPERICRERNKKTINIPDEDMMRMCEAFLPPDGKEDFDQLVIINYKNSDINE